MKASTTLLATLILCGVAACRHQSTKVVFPTPIDVPQGRLVGYYDPDAELYGRSPPIPVTVLLQPSGTGRTLKIRLTQGKSKFGLFLTSVGGHCYIVSMAEGGGPPAAGKASGFVGVVTQDVIIQVEASTPRYLILRFRHPMWSNALPPR